ncbi:hypothetical protein TGAMA5MH_02031 [Trichoderma gamsii]|uniref:F-box domain-containing protein n=1 Tax=Trichoderma gamsii TaxID=398673 RepID=A0A2K0TM36_9HYPO|nr:hypothetical protein TGAMA5MH_02031 [Trichoderma gamsii]
MYPNAHIKILKRSVNLVPADDSIPSPPRSPSPPPQPPPLPLTLAQRMRQSQSQMPTDRPKRRDYGPRRRRESLDALLDGLSSWDLLHIRSRFIDGSVRLDGFAGLSELPPEVFAYIIPHLDLQDVLSCYLVSKDWREAWMQGAVASALCSRFFPGLLELYHNDVPDRNQLFRATAQQYMRKLYVKRSFIAWDVGWSSDIFTNAEDPPASRQLGNLREVNFGFGPLTVHYSSGKLAWQPDNCHVIVDDLYTRERSRFSFGMDFISGRPLQLQAVTDSLVVLATSLPQHQSRHRTTTDNGQTITVFHLQFRQSRNVVLPGKFAHCYAQGDTVAFVTRQGHVVMWGWSDTAYELDVDHEQHFFEREGWESDLGGIPGIVFHPTDTDVVYAAWLHSALQPDPLIHIVVVIKFERGKPVKRFESSISHPEYHRDPTTRYSCPAMRLTLTAQKMDNYGGYALGIVQLVLDRGNAPWADKQAKPYTDWLCVTFNVLTETFLHIKYESRRRPNPAQARHFDLCAWEDQLVISWFDEYLVSQGYSHGLEWLQPVPIGDGPSRCAHTSKVSKSIIRQQVEVEDYMSDHGFGRRIFMDKDFFIATTGQGFMLISFNESMDLPGLATRDENGKVARCKNPPPATEGEDIEPPRMSASWDTRKVTSLVRIALDKFPENQLDQPGW